MHLHQNIYFSYYGGFNCVLTFVDTPPSRRWSLILFPMTFDYVSSSCTDNFRSLWTFTRSLGIFVKRQI